MQKKACMHVPVSIAACLALPEKSLSHNQGHPNFSPHSSLSLSGLTSFSIIPDTERSSHGKPRKCANRMPITISKRYLIKMTVCVLTEAPWPPRVLDASRHGLNGASVAGHDRWPLSAPEFPFYMTSQISSSLCALSGIISRRWIPEDVSFAFHCQKPPRLQQTRNKFSCTSHAILKCPLRNASSQQLGYVNWLWTEYMNNWCVVANLSGRRKTAENRTKKKNKLGDFVKYETQ